MSTHAGGRVRAAPAVDSGVVCRESWHLRRSSYSKHRVARLMREASLRALPGYRVRRWAVGKPSVIIPNLLQRQFTTTQPNKAWVTDITSIRTWQGWRYLAVVMDLFSRMIVGWAAEPIVHRELVLKPC